MDNFEDKVTELAKAFPNDSEFGAKVRDLIQSWPKVEKWMPESEKIKNYLESGNFVLILANLQKPEIKHRTNILIRYHDQDMFVGYDPVRGFWYEDILLNDYEVAWYHPIITKLPEPSEQLYKSADNCTGENYTCKP